MKILSNFHTHTRFCDGEDSPEEMVLYAIEQGFHSLGFSGHYYTEFDLNYCMKEIPAYEAEIKRLKQKYRREIRIYLGVEEDAFAPADRSGYDYIIGSSHYINADGRYIPLDSGSELLRECISLFGNDRAAFAEHYYSRFCDYIAKRRPDIIGHFDLITKYDESDGTGFLTDRSYLETALKYIGIAAEYGCPFEVNTGAIARGLRTTPYPHESLLYELKRKNARLVLSSDCHDMTRLDCGFDEAAALLRHIGFDRVYELTDNGFQSVLL